MTRNFFGVKRNFFGAQWPAEVFLSWRSVEIMESCRVGEFRDLLHGTRKFNPPLPMHECLLIIDKHLVDMFEIL